MQPSILSLTAKTKTKQNPGPKKEKLSVEYKTRHKVKIRKFMDAFGLQFYIMIENVLHILGTVQNK